MFEPCTDVVCSFWSILNQGPMTLTITLHTLIVLPMVWIYFDEKKKMERGDIPQEQGCLEIGEGEHLISEKEQK